MPAQVRVAGASRAGVSPVGLGKTLFIHDCQGQARERGNSCCVIEGQPLPSGSSGQGGPWREAGSPDEEPEGQKGKVQVGSSW